MITPTGAVSVSQLTVQHSHRQAQAPAERPVNDEHHTHSDRTAVVFVYTGVVALLGWLVAYFMWNPYPPQWS